MNIHSLRLKIIIPLCVAAYFVIPGVGPAAASVADTPADVVAPEDATAASKAATHDEDDEDDDDWSSGNRHWGRHRHARRSHNADIVSLGHDSVLPAGEHADSVVSIFGSSTSAGDASEAVSVFGNTHVSGPLRESAVSVLGSTYVDSKVDGDAVALLGNIELGPHAEIGGDVVAVLGTVHRDPAAVIHGGTNNIIATSFGDMYGLQAWIRHCLLYGRLLSVAPGLGWAWTVAAGFLAFYVILALMFRSGVSECVATLEHQPGRTALAALLAMLLTPVLLVLLFVTVIGIAAVPFVLAVLFCTALFGKAVMLAWVGHRVLGHRTVSATPGVLPAGYLAHPAFAVLIGGALVTLLYLVPVLGFLFYKLLGIFGFGAVVYTLILQIRARQAIKSERSQSGIPGVPPIGVPPIGETTSVPPPSPPPPSPPGISRPAFTGATAALPRAGFWIRMGALFLDILLVGIVMSLWHPFNQLHVVALAIYGALMWKLRGTTVGGIVLDLQVVRLDGREVDWETSIVRSLGCFLSLFVFGLGFIWIAFDKGNQAWHDKIAGTVVVRVPKSTPLV